MVPAAFELRCVIVHPAHDGGVNQRKAALRHHLHQIAVAEFEPQLPPHAQDDDLPVEMAALEQLIQTQEPGHHTAFPFPGGRLLRSLRWHLDHPQRDCAGTHADEVQTFAASDYELLTLSALRLQFRNPAGRPSAPTPGLAVGTTVFHPRQRRLTRHRAFQQISDGHPQTSGPSRHLFNKGPPLTFRRSLQYPLTGFHDFAQRRHRESLQSRQHLIQFRRRSSHFGRSFFRCSFNALFRRNRSTTFCHINTLGFLWGEYTKLDDL